MNSSFQATANNTIFHVSSLFVLLSLMLSHICLSTVILTIPVQAFPTSPLPSLIPTCRTSNECYKKKRDRDIDISFSYCHGPVSTPLRNHVSRTTSLFASSQQEERTAEEEAFFAKTKELCKERNLSLVKIKNARDLASVRNSPVQPGRVLRTGRVSDASREDIALLFDQLGVKTLVDLRSPTELKDDPTLDRGEVFGDFTSLIFVERKNGVVKELVPGEPRIKRRRRLEGGTNPLQKLIRGHAGGSKSKKVESLMPNNSLKEHDMQHEMEATINDTVHAHGNANNDDDESRSSPLLLASAVDVAAITAEESDENDGLIVETISDDAARLLEEDDDDEEEEDEENEEDGHGEEEETIRDKQMMKNTNRRKRRFAKIYPPGAVHRDITRQDRKERHFVSIMNEIKYVKGTVSKVRKRDIAKVLIESPGALVSKRVRGHIKKPFLDEINGGGLPMLNELLLKYGAPGIHYVLDLCKDRSRHPIAFYCTAGKDRTGVIAAIMLAAIGVPEEDIVEDYSLSANVYAEMNDHKAMVGALSQRSLDAKTFLGAPPQVMRDTLANIKKDWGSVEGYLDWIGFDEKDRAQLKSALTEP